ncbi:RNA polymerase sigma factor [candidate division WOR-3 bacterium]|nr:RNA polymerase sigma factor [candidate division WOR-3 bacterium]
MLDEELYLKCKKGDTKAFRDLYEKYSKSLFNYIYRMTGDYELSEDIFHETFFRMLTKTFVPKAKLSTWLYKIATNLCYKEFNKRKREKNNNRDLVTDNAENFQQALEKKDLIERAKNAVSSLPDIHRAVFTLRFYQNKSYEEISQILGIPEGTVKSRMHYAVQSLRKFFKGGNYGM